MENLQATLKLVEITDRIRYCYQHAIYFCPLYLEGRQYPRCRSYYAMGSPVAPSWNNRLITRPGMIIIRTGISRIGMTLGGQIDGHISPPVRWKARLWFLWMLSKLYLILNLIWIIKFRFRMNDRYSIPKHPLIQNIICSIFETLHVSAQIVGQR